MTLGSGPALQARAVRGEVFADRAGSGFDKLTDLEVDKRTILEATQLASDPQPGNLDADTRDAVFDNVPTRAETGAAAFQAGEITERSVAELGKQVGETANPVEGMGPRITEDESGGDLPTVAAEVIGGTFGAVAGFPLHYPVTAQAGIDRDATSETRELDEAGDLRTPDEVSPETSPDDMGRQVADINPGVERGDVTVSRREDGGFGGDDFGGADFEAFEIDAGDGGFNDGPAWNLEDDEAGADTGFDFGDALKFGEEDFERVLR